MTDIPYWGTHQDTQRFSQDGPDRLTLYQKFIFETVKDSGNTGCTTNNIKTAIMRKVHRRNTTAMDNWMCVKTLKTLFDLEDEKVIQLVQNRWRLHPLVRIAIVILP